MAGDLHAVALPVPDSWAEGSWKEEGGGEGSLMWLRGGGGGEGCVLPRQHFAVSFRLVVLTAFFCFNRSILSVWSDKYAQIFMSHF